MPWGSLISGGLGLLGNIFSAKSAQSGAESANAASLAAAREQMAFQENMFKHRHQWEVEDLKAAGLNPILSAMNGQPPVTSGAMPDVQNTKAISSGIMANTAKMLSETMLNRALVDTERKKQENLDAQTANLAGNLNLLGVRVPLSTLGNWIKSGTAAAADPFGKFSANSARAAANVKSMSRVVSGSGFMGYGSHLAKMFSQRKAA